MQKLLNALLTKFCPPSPPVTPRNKFAVPQLLNLRNTLVASPLSIHYVFLARYQFYHEIKTVI